MRGTEWEGAQPARPIPLQLLLGPARLSCPVLPVLGGGGWEAPLISDSVLSVAYPQVPIGQGGVNPFAFLLSGCQHGMVLGAPVRPVEER